MKVFLDSVGCRLNQSEIELYARQFRAAGHSLVSDVSQADTMVLNSCAVTAPAASDSRQKIRQAQRAGVQNIVVTGCWSTLEADTAEKMSAVSLVVPNTAKDSLVSDLLQIDLADFDLEPFDRTPIPGSRLRTRAFIKVQDGCDNHCTFCITTVARGVSRSRSVGDIIADIQAAIRGGTKEIVLTGVHLGSWGYDFGQPSHIKQLIIEILQRTDIPRIRVSSLEPWDLNQSFFELWQDERLCRHLHLPLQSGSTATLRRMARNTTPTKFANLLASARKHIPNVAITTDLITGFPGETQLEFAETCAFVEEMQFSGAHVFTYSLRPGTAAASMPNHVHNAARKERNAQLRALVAKSTTQYQQAFVGERLDVLWENSQQVDPTTWIMEGLTDNYLRVKATVPDPCSNVITPTLITSIKDGVLVAEVQFDAHDIWFDEAIGARV